MSGRTVLVIGADGVLGTTVAATFARAGWVVRRGTRRHPSTPDQVHIDLTSPETFARALGDADLTINTVADTDLAAERWALFHGARVINLATVPITSARKLRITAAQNPCRGAVLLNVGIAPGVVNLVIAEMLQRHPEADTVDFVMCLPATGMSGRGAVDFVHENLTTIGRHGVYSRRAPQHDTIKVTLPEPVGRKKCFGFAERERAWLLDTAGGRIVRSYAYLDSARLHHLITTLNPLGLLSDVPKYPFLAGRRSIPARPSTEPIVHWTAALRRGEILDARSIECAGAYIKAAAAAEAFGDAFLRAALTNGLTGCFNPEELFTLTELRPRLETCGITVVERHPASQSGAPRTRVG